MNATGTEISTSHDQSTTTHLIALHAALLVFGAGALGLAEPAKGWAVLATVTAYVVGLQIVCRRSGRSDLIDLAGFLAIVSVFQVLPDWVLADVVRTLRFPDTGGPRMDDVIPVAMAGMWVAPLFAAVLLARFRPARSALLAMIIFAGSELIAPVVGLWEPSGDTTRVLGVAIYVLPAEAALGWATATAFLAVRGSGLGTRIATAATVSTFYLGALTLAYFVIDVANWTVTW